MSFPVQRDHRIISAWLLIGVIMVFVQILLGGITRLTGSGLSITRWEIVTGTLPPMNADEWKESFDLYKQTPQYQKINEGMTMAEFKFIFFWEYLHRLWARLMGFVFAIPFLFFLARKSLTKTLLKRLGVVVLLAGLAAIFGWIMVASGLTDRPWVNAYKLAIHLGLGVSLFIYLFFTWLSHRGYNRYHGDVRWKRPVIWMLVLVSTQFILGGLMSGMKAALNYPTWPLMHGDYIPEVLLVAGNWNLDNILLYDQSGFMAALVQFLHRNLAYIILLFSIVFGIRWHRTVSSKWQWVSILLVGIIVVQAALGILTLLHSIGSIPVIWGVLHQGFGIILLTFMMYVNQIVSPKAHII